MGAPTSRVQRESRTTNGRLSVTGLLALCRFIGPQRVRAHAIRQFFERGCLSDYRRPVATRGCLR